MSHSTHPINLLPHDASLVAPAVNRIFKAVPSVFSRSSANRTTTILYCLSTLRTASDGEQPFARVCEIIRIVGRDGVPHVPGNLLRLPVKIRMTLWYQQKMTHKDPVVLMLEYLVSTGTEDRGGDVVFGSEATLREIDLSCA